MCLNCPHSYSMYNKNVRGSGGAGVGSILSRGDAGTPSELHVTPSWRGEELEMQFSPRPGPFAEAQQAIHLHTVRDPTGGAPPGAQERGTPKAGAAAGETAVNRGRGQGRGTLPALLKVCPRPLKAGFPSVLSASVFSPKFAILTLLYKS